jgi:lysophospholipase L1-like esterase
MTPKRILRSLLIGFISFHIPVTTAVTVPAPAATTPVPDSMASLGDSITRGFNACGWYVDCTSRSWSTGSYGPVNSHYLRIVATNPAMSGHAHNDARSGARVSDLNRQAQLAVSQNVEYVTILIGANDACTSSESRMTTVAAYESRFRTAMTTLDTGLPRARIFVASIPDIKRLWFIGNDSFAARSAWLPREQLSIDAREPSVGRFRGRCPAGSCTAASGRFQRRPCQGVRRVHAMSVRRQRGLLLFVLIEPGERVGLLPLEHGRSDRSQDVTYRAGFGW